MKNGFLKVLKVVLIVLLILVLLAAAYVAYVLISYHRIGDQQLDPDNSGTSSLSAGAPFTVISYNIGFGAYESDFGFFMDGGDRSWAWSKERLDSNLKNIAALLSEQDASLLLVQEVDIDSTRSYHVDERVYLTETLSGESDPRSFVFCQNYDSPFLFYPILQPHGASKSGIMTFSRFPITEAVRVELPVEEGLHKLLDLDRCYSKCRIPVESEPGAQRELIVFNFHLSAYTSDGSIADTQLRLLLDDIRAEYGKGNYCIAGGDFNKSLLKDYFGTLEAYSWAQPIPEELLAEYPVKLVAPLDEQNPVPSCRNADGPYSESQFVLTIDGFLVTENVTVLTSDVLDTGFRFSDHNPVRMTFSLNG